MAVCELDVMDVLSANNNPHFTATLTEPKLDVGVFGDPTITQIIAVYNVKNSMRSRYFELCKEEIAKSNGGNANEMNLYHATIENNILSICEYGLDIRMAKIGFYGRGIYFSDEPSKANDYSQKIGNTQAVRVMLECSVILGKIKEYNIGESDRDLVREHKGYNSNKGFLRRAYEYVVYRSEQICINRIIFYKWINSDAETKNIPSVPANFCGTIAHIPVNIMELFRRIEGRANIADRDKVRHEIRRVIRKEQTVKQFLDAVSAIIKSQPPADLQEKLEKELHYINIRSYTGNQANQTVQSAQSGLPGQSVQAMQTTEKDDKSSKRARTDGE